MGHSGNGGGSRPDGKTSQRKSIAYDFRRPAGDEVKKRKLKYVLGKDLIAGHVGQTALKTDGVIDQALDGILFLDEAYSMVHGSKEAQVFGLQAIDTLLARMENEFDRLVVI
ncbi:AAA family ATPase, partial [Mycobacteroides abscessus]|uniref:AAA family ATPase n=1 Tax=Mycobacteroides abscessus TaxID=36809 RepID=UPI0010554052